MIVPVVPVVLAFLAAAPPGQTPPSGAHDSAAASADPPNAGSPSAGSPSAGSPSAGSPSPGSPSAGSPSAGSDSAVPADALPLDGARAPIDAVGALDEAARVSGGTMAPTKIETVPPPEPPRALPPPSLGMGELLGQLVKMVLMLGVVVGLAYLTLNKGLGKLVERQNLGKRVKVVERVALDAKRSLFLVDLDGKQMLLGGGEGGVVFIRDVDTRPTATAATVPSPKSSSFTDTLKRAVGEPPVTTGLAKAVEDKTA